MHPTEGDLRAYNDHELGETEQGRITAHLAACPECRQQAGQLGRRAAWAQERLALLAPEQPALPARAARARLASYPTENKERRLMKTVPFARQYRPLWGGLAIAAMLVLALLLPPVRALASDFLRLFRVQSIEVVEVSPDDLPAPFAESAVQVELLLADNVHVEPRGEPSDADSAATASALAGFPVRLPTAATGEPRIRVQPGAQVTLDIDLPRVRTLLRELGQTEIALPDSLDGKQVIVDVPAAVTAAYGPCQDAEDGAEGSDSCVVLMQLPSPTVSGPPELDVNQLGAAFLQLMGRNAEDAALLSGQVDWSTTLVVPIPSSYTDYEEVQVDGVRGILIEKLVDENVPRFMTLWVREGIVYALIGAQSGDEALTIANSLQ